MQVAYARSFGCSDTGLLGVYYVTELDKIMEAQWVGLLSRFDLLFFGLGVPRTALLVLIAIALRW
jgi:hypothetical protein